MEFYCLLTQCWGLLRLRSLEVLSRRKHWDCLFFLFFPLFFFFFLELVVFTCGWNRMVSDLECWQGVTPYTHWSRAGLANIYTCKQIRKKHRGRISRRNTQLGTNRCSPNSKLIHKTCTLLHFSHNPMVHARQIQPRCASWLMDQPPYVNLHNQPLGFNYVQIRSAHATRPDVAKLKSNCQTRRCWSDIQCLKILRLLRCPFLALNVYRKHVSLWTWIAWNKAVYEARVARCVALASVCGESRHWQRWRPPFH